MSSVACSCSRYKPSSSASVGEISNGSSDSSSREPLWNWQQDVLRRCQCASESKPYGSAEKRTIDNGEVCVDCCGIKNIRSAESVAFVLEPVPPVVLALNCSSRVLPTEQNARDAHFPFKDQIGGSTGNLLEGGNLLLLKVKQLLLGAD